MLRRLANIKNLQQVFAIKVIFLFLKNPENKQVLKRQKKIRRADWREEDGQILIKDRNRMCLCNDGGLWFVASQWTLTSVPFGIDVDSR